ncbi:MAG: HAMP domain-containing sensor histidine kinase [Candidatus Paceibacterota bacterium]
MADRFVGIANDAQERLVNIRVGSIQDSFVVFAGDRIKDTVYLNRKIYEVINANETIKNFRIVVKNNSTTTPQGEYMVLASNDESQIGAIDTQADLLYTLASGDSNHSLTIQLNGDDERLFQTARAIKGSDGNILGVVMTTQTLSQADELINSNIKNSMILLAVIIVFIMLLFLRHSKIVDYMELYKRLKEVDQLKDDFVSMASHELRTPLTIIRGYAEFIRDAKELLPETKDFAEKIDVSAKNLDNLVGDILDVSKIQQGRMSFSMSKISPVEILDVLMASFALPAKEKGLAIFFDKSGVSDEQIIFADKDRLKQVLTNLIGNAVKYTMQGEVKVRQYTENRRLCIRVSDTGIGISAEERERLFEKFYRIRTKETENIRGTGLGLWITHQIVTEMKGDISVESIKGVGSHFILSFPIISK